MILVLIFSFSFTLAESSTLESSPFALASGISMTPLLAAARDQLIAGLGCFLKCGQMWFVYSTICLDPTPTTWRWKHRVWSKCLPPNMTTLENCLTCCSRAVRVGGILCTEEVFAKSFFLALFTSVQVLVRS